MDPAAAPVSAPERAPDANSDPARVDCVVVGGGPAGLTAAIYLSRFRLRTLVVDGGDSRAAWIPRTRNHAGFPDGIAGTALLDRMRDQALRYGTALIRDQASALAITSDGFAITAGDAVVSAPAVLLATGVVNNRPAMDDALHDAALAQGALRYCPICDGYEVTDARVLVIGTGERGMHEAEFLRSYTADVTMIAPDGRHDLSQDERARLAAAGVALVDGPCRGFALGEDGLRVTLDDATMTFASAYPALGSVIRSDLAVAVGAEAGGDGCLVVDAHQRTSIPGLYAAGDVVMGLDQISHAMGQAGVAAATIRNDLAARHPLRR